MYDAIILAGGLGTRLQPAFPHLPKVLAPICGTPFIDILLSQLHLSGCIDKVIIAAGHKADCITSHFENNPSPLPLLFSIEDTPLGTGGAVKKALQLSSSEHLFVMNGDCLIHLSFTALLNQHLALGADCTLTYLKMKNPDRYGRLLVDPLTHQITAFGDHLHTNTINAGFYVLDRKALEEISLESSFSLEKEGFPLLLRKRFFGFFYEGLFIDIGTPDAYLTAQNLYE